MAFVGVLAFLTESGNLDNFQAWVVAQGFNTNRAKVVFINRGRVIFSASAKIKKKFLNFLGRFILIPVCDFFGGVTWSA